MIDKYEDSKVDREQQISKIKAKIEQCKRERQTVLRQVRKNNIKEVEADAEFTVINKEQVDWQHELDNLMTLDTEADALVDRFWSQLQAVDKSFDYWLCSTEG